MVQNIILHEAELLVKICSMEDISYIQEILYEEENNEKDYNLLDRLFFYLSHFIRMNYQCKSMDTCKRDTLSYMNNIFFDYQILSGIEFDRDVTSMYLIYMYCGKFDNRKTKKELLDIVDYLLNGSLLRNDWRIQLLQEKLDILLNSEHLDLGLIIETNKRLKELIKR
ncbi:MAG: hypothetical protein ACRDDY_15505 [Clostridium sp.]|uniref:hypothetical protein n=1 Tax=Clostridium sp. TaxID=1506 RepID=UPI003EE7B2A4